MRDRPLSARVVSVSADFHIHATAYRGFDEGPDLHLRSDPDMTVEAVVRRARELGLLEIGILEHLAPSRGRPLTPIERIKRDREKLPPAGDLRVFLGLEIDVTAEGTFEGPSDVRGRLGLDYVVAGVHYLSPGTPDTLALEDHSRRMLALLAGPVSFDVMAHPWRGVLKQVAAAKGRPATFDLVTEAMQGEFIAACAYAGVAVEVNAGSSLDDPAHDAFLSRALDAGLKLATGSDAHYLHSLGAHRKCAAVLARIGAGPADLWHPIEEPDR